MHKQDTFLLTFDLKALASMPTEAWLDVWILRAGGAGGYPAEAAPVALVRAPALRAAATGLSLLHAAQVALARRAASLTGNTSIYDLLVWALDELPGMLTVQTSSAPASGRPGRDKSAAVTVAISPSPDALVVDSVASTTTTTMTGSAAAAATSPTGGSSRRNTDKQIIMPRLPGASEPLWSSRSSGSAEHPGGGGVGRGSAGTPWRRGRGGGGGGPGRGEGHQKRSGTGLLAAERKRGRERVEASKEFAGRRRQRQALPAAKARDEFLAMVRSSQVVLVSGETGCGKTTQIPQFLLEEWEEGSGLDEFRVLVTQPRRIAAVGVAQRVADERCERVGEGVGYKIRGESKAGPDTRLLFCTTGLLLRRMQGDPQLDELTHLVVDEVHERHLDADFLLALLIGILPKRSVSMEDRDMG